MATTGNGNGRLGARSALGLSWEDLQAGLREGRLGERTALAWLEASRGGHQVRAHSNSAVGQVVHRAVDQALGLGSAAPADEFTPLFPPTAPLGPPGEHQTEPRTSLVYPGEGQGRRRREPVTWDGYVSASADAADLGDLSEDDLDFIRLYGRRPGNG